MYGLAEDEHPYSHKVRMLIIPLLKLGMIAQVDSMYMAFEVKSL